MMQEHYTVAGGESPMTSPRIAPSTGSSGDGPYTSTSSSNLLGNKKGVKFADEKKKQKGKFSVAGFFNKKP